MDAASTDRKKTLERVFELAFRLLEGEPLDVQTLQRELRVSRATAYRYWRLARSHRSGRSQRVDVRRAGACDVP